MIRTCRTNYYSYVFRMLMAFVLLIGFAFQSFAQSDKQIIIGTGAPNGVYYPAGGAICRLINLNRSKHNIRCLVEATGGSVFNLYALHNNEVNFAIVQSDWQYNAFKGKGLFAEGPAYKNLRSVFSLHSEMFTVAARGDANIKTFDDLKGKRVNIGNPGSGMRAIMQDLIDTKGWHRNDFKEMAELKPDDASAAFCAGKLDAVVFAAGHPNGLIQKLTNECGAKLIAVDDASVDALLTKNPYYARTVIPGGMYKGNAQNIPTFGVKATLVTDAKMSDDTVYAVVKSVFENFDDFKTLHFVFATLDKQRMIASGLTALLHDGAVRYYREAGLMK